MHSDPAVVMAGLWSLVWFGVGVVVTVRHSKVSAGAGRSVARHSAVYPNEGPGRSVEGVRSAVALAMKRKKPNTSTASQPHAIPTATHSARSAVTIPRRHDILRIMPNGTASERKCPRGVAQHGTTAH